MRAETILVAREEEEQGEAALVRQIPGWRAIEGRPDLGGGLAPQAEPGEIHPALERTLRRPQVEEEAEHLVADLGEQDVSSLPKADGHRGEHSGGPMVRIRIRIILDESAVDPEPDVIVPADQEGGDAIVGRKHVGHRVGRLRRGPERDGEVDDAVVAGRHMTPPEVVRSAERGDAHRRVRVDLGRAGLREVRILGVGADDPPAGIEEWRHVPLGKVGGPRVGEVGLDASAPLGQESALEDPGRGPFDASPSALAKSAIARSSWPICTKALPRASQMDASSGRAATALANSASASAVRPSLA